MIQPYALDAVVEYVRKTEDPRDYRVSFSRITDQLGYRITRTVAQGIEEVAKLVTSNVIETFDDPRYSN
jgi:hypothetical protein